MMTRIPASQRYLARHGWLTSYHLFSFAEYYDPTNVQFGSLRVFNDDTIDAYSGFDEHGHENMEIVTIVHRGRLTHRDSMGNQEVIKAGEVQRMSAGTGVIHAEKNLGDEPVHLYQIWLMPDQENIQPSYAQKDFSSIPERSGLTPLVSGSLLEGAISMQTNATIYSGFLEAGGRLLHKSEEDRGIFLYVKQGSLEINKIIFHQGDQLRAWKEDLLIQAMEEASFILIDVPLKDQQEDDCLV